MKLILYQATIAITEIDFEPGPFRCQIEQQHIDFAVFGVVVRSCTCKTCNKPFDVTRRNERFHVVCQRVSRPPSGSRRVPASSRLSVRARACNFRGGSGSACAPVPPFACARRGLLHGLPVGGRISQTEGRRRLARGPRVPPSSPVGRCAFEKKGARPVD